MWMKANQMPSVENQFCDASECSFAGMQGFSRADAKSPAVRAGLFRGAFF